MRKRTTNNLLLRHLFRQIAVAGNALYFLWILYNGMASGFAARGVRLVSYIGILALLIFNIVLLISYRARGPALPPSRPGGQT